MLGRCAKRAEDTAAYTYKGDRSAAELCVRLVGGGSGEAKRAIETAARLESLPATAAAVQAGTLSAQASGLIAAAAVDDPSVERDLLKAAAHGMPKLRDTCVAVRAAREDQTARSARQKKLRSYRSWTNADGMCEGHYVVTPEVGGAINAKIEAGARRRFREAPSDGVREPQDAYAADAFAEAILGDPTAAKAGGDTVHVISITRNSFGARRFRVRSVRSPASARLTPRPANDHSIPREAGARRRSRATTGERQCKTRSCISYAVGMPHGRG